MSIISARVCRMGGLLSVAVFFGMAVPAGSAAQDARQVIEQQLGRSVSPEEIVERLRSSGLSRAQVRARLQQAGYDPSLADPYFDAIERGAQPPQGDANERFLQTLKSLGVAVREGAEDPNLQAPSAAGQAGILPDTAPTVPLDTLAPGELPIFGRDLFQRATSQFQPVLTGPVDPGYRLGPGDQIALVLTGDVEAAYTLDVTREGDIIIPDVGQVSVNGLTIRELEDRLYGRLGQVYSGIGRSPGATAHFQVSLGRLRTNQVFLIGEVERPGAYQVSSVATVFNALYAARGPNKSGSFRRVEVRRGGQVIRTVDLYDYLLHGDSRGDVRLEQGDVIFVPLVGPQVSVKGAVRRPAIYELDGDDGLRDLLAYSGGTSANAVMRRIQIDRIVSPDARRPGVDRVLVDVDVARLASSGGEPVRLQNGDIVQVFSVSSQRRNRLTMLGEVHRPGVYEWSPSTTLWDVIERAEGLSDGAYTPRAHIFRLNREDGTRRLIRTPLLADSAGRPLQDVQLADLDSVVIYSRADLRMTSEVTVSGFVKSPGTYALAAGMTVRDLILAAGGFKEGADMRAVDVARRPDWAERTDTTARVYRVALDSAEDGGPGYVAGVPGSGRRSQPADGVPVWVPSADELELQADDQVFVRRAPGYEPLRPVAITGEVKTPGNYVLRSRQERLVDALERAGGVTGEANPAGLRLVRDGSLVATDLPRALQQPGSRFNLVLEPGDSIIVPRSDPTVLVTGAVGFESRVLYQPGQGMDYYINRAGGYRDDADPGRVSIAYQDGERAAVRERLLFFDQKPSVQPGSTIIVPRRPETAQGFDWDRFLSRTLSIVSTTVTLIIAADRLGS